jgi:uncharacterized membrane protein YeaQ/YmgE (transglycosylase-associated protein family)
MRRNFLLWTFITVGSLLGGWIPTLFGSASFSLASFVGGFLGSLAGIYGWYKLSQCTDI